MKIITVSSVKGGVGKTTFVINIAYSFLDKGARVLLIDQDPNNNLTHYLLGGNKDLDIVNSNSYHFLTGKKTAKECIYKADDFDIIPATQEVNFVHDEMIEKKPFLLNLPSSLLRLKPKLKTLKEYDYILIDSPPQQTYIMISALFAADIVLAPAQFNDWDFQGSQTIEAHLNQVLLKSHAKPIFKVIPYMVTKSQAEKMQIENENRKEKYPLTINYIKKGGTVQTAVNKKIRIKLTSPIWSQFVSLSEEIYAFAS